MDPTPSLPNIGNYVVGLGLGFVPLILFLISPFPVLIPVYIFLWLVFLIVAIVCLRIDSVRLVGYGLLTAFLVTPVVVSISCVVFLTRVYHY
jgi:hypothetical protein